MGATDNVAWTMTNTRQTTPTFYRETRNPANPLHYLRDGVWVDARAEIVTIKRQGSRTCRSRTITRCMAKYPHRRRVRLCSVDGLV